MRFFDIVSIAILFALIFVTGCQKNEATAPSSDSELTNITAEQPAQATPALVDEEPVSKVPIIEETVKIPATQPAENLSNPSETGGQKETQPATPVSKPEVIATKEVLLTKELTNTPEMSAQTSLLLSELAGTLHPEAEYIQSQHSNYEKIWKLKSVVSGGAVTPESLERLYRDLEAESDPEVALARIDSFAAFYQLASVQELQLESLRQEWVTPFNERMMRVKDRFVPRDQLDEEVRSLINGLQNVVRLCEAKQPIEPALKTLKQAVRESSESLIAVYLSGLCQAIWLNDTRGALTDFRRVTNEMPEHAGAWNNLAICEIKSRNFSKALSCWRKAVASSQNLSDRSIILHNISYAVAISQSDKLKTPASFRDTAARLMADAAPFVTQQSARQATFWRFSPWVAKPEIAAAVRDYPDAAAIPPQILRPLKRVPALAIGGDLLLVATNNLSIAYLGRSQNLRVLSQDLQVTSSTGEAKIVATNQELGLTLLRCPALAAPPLELATKTVQADETVHVGLLAQDQSLKFSAKTCHLSPSNATYAFGLQPNESENLITGTPVFDSQGALTGIVSPVASSATENPIQLVWTADTIRKFLTAAEVIAPKSPKPVSGTWESKQHFLGNHLVQIELCYPEECLSLELAQRTKFNRPHYLINCSCLNCDGRSRVSCDAKGCVKGQTTRRYTGITGYTMKGAPLYGLKMATERCKRCSGNATLDCPQCSDGTQAMRGSIQFE